MKPIKLKLPILIIIGAGVFIRLAYILSPPEKLITIVPDDAFYYFKIAQNIASGIGSSFDGINLTNGYHPAWMIVLLPLTLATSQPWTLVRLGLFLAVLLNSLTAVLVYKFLENKTKSYYIASAGTAIYFLNPKVIANNLNGLETSLASLALMLIIILVDKKAIFKKTHSYVFLAILFGLCFLSRTDLVFYLAPLFFYVFYQVKTTEKNLKTTGKKMAVFSFSFLATILPWFGWNLLKFRTIFQSSANTVPFVLKNSYMQNGPSTTIVENSLRLSYHFFSKDLLPTMGFSYLWAIILLLILVSCGLTKSRKLHVSNTNKRELVFLLLLLIGGLGLSFVHVFFRWYPRPWYFDQLILITSLLVSFLMFLVAKTGSCLRNSIIVMFVLITMASGIKNVLRINEYPHQVEMLSSSEWLKNNINPNQIVVSFNSGILGFFSDRTVVNLDGAVNQNAYLAIKKNQLWQIPKQLKADYYIDYDPFMIDLYRPFLGESFSKNNLKLVKVINRPEVSWEGNNIKIYAVSKSK